ncbi:MAG: phosphotransferase [Gammaproteobacteria bacterium]|nr:phosphotransferase [Gammaproteobacteria bacterium]
MPPSTLEQFALRWVPGAGPVDIHVLASGLVNESCRVARAGRSYSMRVATANSQDLGLDREWECKVLEYAAAAGLAPAIARCEPAAGVLVADWVTGRAWTPEEVGRPEQIRAMAELLGRVHALPIPQPARVMDPAAWVALYSDALIRRRGELPARCATLRGAADARLSLGTGGPLAEPVLCHSDLHRFNVTVGPNLMLLDWEYAHVSTAYWDLAGWTANNDGTGHFAGALLENYLQRSATPAEAEHLAQLVWLYDYVCLLWSELYLIQRPGAASDGVSARADQLASRLRSPRG